MEKKELKRVLPIVVRVTYILLVISVIGYIAFQSSLSGPLNQKIGIVVDSSVCVLGLIIVFSLDMLKKEKSIGLGCLFASLYVVIPVAWFVALFIIVVSTATFGFR